MKKNSISIVLLFVATIVVAQKTQRIAYIDMEYILQNVPEYLEAQNSLDAKVEKWKSRLDKEARHIEVLKTDLANEKTILTEDLVVEREEDITIKQESLRRLESLYFGPNGDMYNLRKQLIQPVQDQVYNAIQTIAKRKKYDFVFDKSSELVLLYSNKKNDISELVLKLINIEQKQQAKKDKIAQRIKLIDNTGVSEEIKKRLAKKEELKAKRKAAKEAKLKQIQEKRAALLKAREEKRKLLLQKKEALRKKLEEAKKKKLENSKQ